MSIDGICISLPKEYLGLKVQLMCDSLPKLLLGIPLTIELVAISLSIGFVLAMCIALMRISGSRLLNIVSRSYVFYFRGTPLLVQIFLIYYGLAQFDLIKESFLWPFFREVILVRNISTHTKHWSLYRRNNTRRFTVSPSWTD